MVFQLRKKYNPREAFANRPQETRDPPDIDPTNGANDSPLLDVLAKIHVTLNGIQRVQADQYIAWRKEQQRLAQLPLNIPLSTIVTPGAATTALYDFGGPQPGRQWVFRLITAFASPLAANASVVTWYVGQIGPGPAAGQLPATMAVWQFASVPAQQNFTTDVVKVQPGEHVIAGFTGVPASSQIAIRLTINDQPILGASGAVAVE